MRVLPAIGTRAGSAGDGPCRRSHFRLVRRWWFLLVLLGLTGGAAIVARPHLRAWYYRRAARLESQRYHNGQAIRHLLICREIWPRDPEVLLLAARAARRAQVYGDADRLLKIYREVRGRDEAHTFEQLLLAAECRVDTYSEECWKCVEQGRFDEQLLMEALTRGYLRQYRLGQARMCLDRWKEVHPDNPQIYYLEGLFNLDYLHAMSTAADSYRHALELDPDHEEAHLGYAVALLEGKNYVEAGKHFDRLLQIQPENLRVQVGLAECLEGQGETAEAERIVDEVLAQQPQFASALSLRGQFALKKGQWAEAATALRQALRGNPLDHRARYSLIRCLEQNGQEEEAQQQHRQLQQLEEDTARFHDIVTKEIAQRPHDPALHYTLGKLFLRVGQREEGIRWLHSALSLDPNYAPARQMLAEYQSQAKGETQLSSP
ncbi:MAG TPA: tetratricopeptide repeat protein [Gemmataceae bacterium]|nr:tetratricopeptide repeat protein [Gemmataceae bacterium]